MDKVAYIFYGIGAWFIVKALLKGLPQGSIDVLLIGFVLIGAGFAVQQYLKE